MNVIVFVFNVSFPILLYVSQYKVRIVRVPCIFDCTFSSVNVKDKFMNEYNLNCVEGWEIGEEKKKQKVSFNNVLCLRDGLVGNMLA